MIKARTFFLFGIWASLLILGTTFARGPSEAASQAKRNLTAGTLCLDGEKVVFSCQLKQSSKLVSLCSSPKLTRTEGYMQYRFGSGAKLELEFPKDRNNSQQAFQYSHYFRARVDLTEISFSSDGYSYNVFDSYNGEEKRAVTEQGVTVTTPKGREVTYNCRGRAKADFSDLPEAFDNSSP